MFAALGRIYEGLPSPAVFGTHLILYSRRQQKSTLKYTFFTKFPPFLHTRRHHGKGPGKTTVFPVLSPTAKEEISIIFGRTCACRKYPDLCAPGAHTPVTAVTGGGGSQGGACSPLKLTPASRCSSSRRGPWWRRRRSCGYTGPWRWRAWP